MSWRNIHIGDFGWVGRLRIVQDGEPVDISDYTTLRYFYVKPDDPNTKIEKTVEFDTDGEDGYLAYTHEEGFIDTLGYWTVYAQVSRAGVDELTSKPIRFNVKARGT